MIAQRTSVLGAATFFTPAKPRALTLVRCQPPTTTSETEQKASSIALTLSALDALVPEPPKPAAVQPKPKPAPAPAPTARPQGSTWGGVEPPSTSGRPASISGSSSRGQKYDFGSVMGFSGLAPETINGRAAMIGFVAALANELGNGESVFAQCVSGGFAKAGLVILVVTLASFAPAIRGTAWDAVFGKDKKPAEFGPFNANAELINGRAAMLGLATIMLIEGASSYAFFM